MGYYLNSDIYRNQLKGKMQGTKVFSLSRNNISNTLISYPNLAEQTAIATTFQNLDRTITTKKQQHEKTKNIKKALLTKMFPQNGAKVPEVRCTGFSGEWKSRRLEDVVKFRRGLTYTPYDVSKTGVRVLRSSNVKDDVFLLFDNDVFVNEQAVNIPFVKTGDILITAANGSINLIGKHAIININYDNVVHGGFMILCEAQNPHFINAWMDSVEYKKMLGLVQGGNGSIVNLSIELLNNTTITLPAEEEQTAIATIFKNLDNLLQSQTAELYKLENIKKALLAKMFV